MSATRRLPSRQAAAVVVLVAAAVAWWVPAGSASGAAPDRQGWWKAESPLAGLGLGDVAGLGAPDTADVPDDGLLVAGGSGDQPDAVAAVAFRVEDGTIAGPLRLVPDPEAATVPGSAATACPLDVPEFAPAQGGPLADAPSYDCFGGVDATVDDDGAYLFDVATVVRGGWVAVAIVPTASTDRIVFAAPDDDALPVAGGADGSGGSGDGELFVGEGGGGTQPGGFSSPGPATPGVVTGPTGTRSAVPPGPVAIDEPPPADPDAPGPRLAEAASLSSAGAGGTTRAYVLVGLAALAGLLWAGAGTAAFAPPSLVEEAT